MRKRALVTGSGGFVGRHMVAELQRRGWAVVGVDLNEGFNCLYWFEDEELVYDLVVHCAYHVGGRAAIDGRNMNLAANVQLDASLFDWAVRTGQRRVLYFSSSAAYPVWMQRQDVAEDDFWGPMKLAEGAIDLDDLSTPDADYGFAKLVGERLARRARENGVPVTVVRPFSGYGGDQSLDYPFPAVVKRASEGDLTVWGPKGQTRDWIHISDVVNGALAVVEAEYDGPVNLCTGRGVEMGMLAWQAYHDSHLVGSMPDLSLVTYDESKPTGVFYRVGDPELMRQFYTPKVTLEEGISRALRARA